MWAKGIVLPETGDRGDLDEAERCLLDGAALAAASQFAIMRHRYAAARCRLLVGQSYLSERRFAQALPFLEDALQTFASCGDWWSEGVTAYKLAQEQERTGRPGEAQRRRGHASWSCAAAKGPRATTFADSATV